MERFPLISIIVPVYKVEAYLRKCVDSILAQTYTNIEVILIDDGSPDGCPAICDEYAARDSRVVVFHKENGGLSDARNVGIAKANGEYVTFIDSDDYVARYYVEHLLSLKESTGADISMISQRTVRENGGKQVDDSDRNLNDVKIYNQEDSIKGVLCGTVRQSAWGNLYPKILFDDIRFPIGMVYEDLAIVFYILLKCKKIAISSNRDYNYRIRKTSIMHEKFSMKQYYSFASVKKEFEYLLTFYPKYKDGVLTKITDAELFVYHSFCKSNLRYEHKQELMNFKNEVITNCKQILDYSKIKNSVAIRIIAFRMGWPVFNLVMNVFYLYINIKQYG